MSFSEYISTLSTERQTELLGLETDDIKHQAFTDKSVVHAGLLGAPVEPAEQQKNWRAAMEKQADPAKAHVVYIHIPFCQTKCLYCGFYQQATQQEAEDDYMDILLEEIVRDAALPQIRTANIDAVFIGGGTPTSLSAVNASRLLAAVNQHFHLVEDCEITFEGRVHDLVPEKIEAWLRGGVNRISLGIQSFDTALRQSVGRLDAREEVFRRLALLKEYDVTVIADLIYGLPGQTKDIWLQDLRDLVSAPVDGMDIYPLNLFPGGALDKAVKNGVVPACADVAGRADLYAEARQFLLDQGFERLSLCHWRRDRCERSLYNTLAMTGAVVYPFGSGAGGNLGGLSFMHYRQAAAYQAAVERDEKPMMMMAYQVEPGLQSVSEIIISRLEKGFLDFRHLCLQNRWLQELAYVLDLWTQRGLLQEDLGIYRLTPVGEFWYVRMTQNLLECAQVLWNGTMLSNAAYDDGNEVALLDAIGELMPEATVAERNSLLQKIPVPVRMMLKRTSPAGLKAMIDGLSPAMWERMLKQAMD